MRNAIMDMQHVKSVVAAHLRHFNGQRQGVVGIFEKIVIIDDHGMKMQPRHIRGQTEWTLVAEEVNVMSATGQFFAESGGEDAAPAHRRITGDADPHRQKARALGFKDASEVSTRGSLGNKAMACPMPARAPSSRERVS